jgi:hypothetical protein
MAQHRLFVGGLPWLTDERQFLNQCLQYVRLPPLQLKVHRKPEQQFSFAFITLQSAEDMALLQQALHLKKVQGCYVTCCVAQDKGWRPPWQPVPKVVPPPKRLKTESADQTEPAAPLQAASAQAPTESAAQTEPAAPLQAASAKEPPEAPPVPSPTECPSSPTECADEVPTMIPTEVASEEEPIREVPQTAVPRLKDGRRTRRHLPGSWVKRSSDSWH